MSKQQIKINNNIVFPTESLWRKLLLTFDCYSEITFCRQSLLGCGDISDEMYSWAKYMSWNFGLVNLFDGLFTLKCCFFPEYWP